MQEDLRLHNEELYKKVNEISEMVREMHQRQNERTIPAVEKIEKVIWGNGKIGILDDVACIKKDIESLHDKTKETRDLRIWVRNMTVTTVISVMGGLLLVIWELIKK